MAAYNTETYERLSINGKTFFFNVGTNAQGTQYLSIRGYASGGKDGLLLYDNQLEAFFDALRKVKIRMLADSGPQEVQESPESRCPGYLDEQYREEYDDFNDQSMPEHTPMWLPIGQGHQICQVCGWEEAVSD